MSSVKGPTSKRSWLVYNPFLTTLMKQLNVKTTFFQIGQIDFPLKGQSDVF